MMDPIKQHTINMIKQGKRMDGRKLEEYRKIEVSYDFSLNAEGSAKVKIGETEIIAGVKLSVEEPFPDKPDEGSLMVSAEFSQIAHHSFEGGPPSGEAIELARVVDRGIRECRAVPPKDLCIEEGKKVWMVSVDINPLNVSGNFLDTSGLASIAAITRAKFPKYDGENVDYKEMTNKKVPLVYLPIPVTVHKIAGKYIVDLSEEEEHASECRLTVTTMDNGNVCSLQKGGTEPITSEDVSKMVDIAVDKGKELRKHLGITLKN